MQAKTITKVLRMLPLDSVGLDPADLRPLATITVWARWFAWVCCVVILAYRPVYTTGTYMPYILFHVLLVALNGCVHYRLLTNRPVTWRWMLALSAQDVILITVALAVEGRFESFSFLGYYPALAVFAVVFASTRLNFAWVTMVVIAYSIVCMTSGPGLDLALKQEKHLFVRVMAMYGIVGSVNLIARIEMVRRQQAVARERELQRERIALSQTIHNTTAQTAYMVELGIESAIMLADESNERQMATLESTAELSRSMLWEMRHPIDAGRIFEGLGLAKALRSHASTFTSITSVPTELVQTGTEPELPPTTRSLLFGIAHNALTNALRHADAASVTIALEFEPDVLRMSVTDDGLGVPEDYGSRGHGFSNMTADAERIGGRIEVESEKSRGTTVTCVLPLDTG